jgi:CTP:molybdopterin cytidylyltransferase MocA
VAALDGPPGLRALFDRYPHRVAEVEADSGVLMDMDTPDDYRLCLERYGPSEPARTL